MKYIFHRLLTILLVLCLLVPLAVPGFAAVSYMPDVTPAMSEAGYWAALSQDADRVLMTPEEIKARNLAAVEATGTMLIDMKSAPETFDGVERNQAIAASAKADAEYYCGWIYDGSGKIADWSFFQKMIDNCTDPRVSREQRMRFGIAVERTTLMCFPTDEHLHDDPADPDFEYNAVSAVNVNEPLWIYTTSRDGRFYLARSICCSGWVRAEDVALCKDRDEWIAAWDIPDSEVLVITGGSVHTGVSNFCPEASERKLTVGTKLRSVEPASVEGLINNRSAYHNYIVELPARDETGVYQKVLALIPETADVHEGYLPLTRRNIAAVMLNNLGDAYGWGGMMDVEDCSGLVRQVYACFGLDIARNTTWQCNMPAPKVDMQDMSVEEKCRILDALPLGTVLTFNGHEMMYLGQKDGKYYVVSTVSSLMNPADTSKRLRARDVMINTLDVRRANGRTWMQEIYQATLMACPDGYALPETEWYHDAVAFCLKNELLTEKTDGYFGVNDAVTRAEAADALWRMAGKPETEAELSFDDVSEENKYAAAIRWAAESGVMLGYGDGAFGAADPLTREQTAVILYRFARQQGAELPAGNAETMKAFPDRTSVSTFALEAIQWACAAGILRGSDGMLLPQSGLTRVQLAAVLQQYDEVLTAAAEEPETAEAE